MLEDTWFLIEFSVLGVWLAVSLQKQQRNYDFVCGEKEFNTNNLDNAQRCQRMKKKHAGQTFQQSCVAAEMLIELKDKT